MANSPDFCQQYLYSILSPYFDKDNALLYVYMDDLIIGYLEESGIAPSVITNVDIFQQHDFKIAPKKIQKVPLFHMLGSQLTFTQAKVNGSQLILPEPLILSGLQKILGEMNWVRPWLPVETGRLDVVYDLLKEEQHYEIISLTFEGHQALTEFINKFHQASLARYNPNIPIQGWILLGKKTMLAAIVQQTQPLDWVHTTLG